MLHGLFQELNIFFSDHLFTQLYVYKCCYLKFTQFYETIPMKKS